MQRKQVSARDRLFRDLTADYNASLNPDKTELTFGLIPRVISYDEVAGELTTQVWEYHSWKDSRLSWDQNSEKYGHGIKQLRVPARHVWTPDTKLHNSVPAVVDRDADVNVVVSYDGTVRWKPVANYKTLAKVVDGNICSRFIVGSWTFSKREVALKAASAEGFDLSVFDAESLYEVVSPNAKIEILNYDEEEYPTLVIDFSVKKRC